MMTTTTRPRLPRLTPHTLDDISARRIAALDVLRGIALLGMLVVHFCAVGANGATEDGLSRFVDLLLADRFMTIFAILFGAGFAIQVARIEARGERVAVVYLRRLAALAVFGLVAEVCFGYRVLLPYAITGLALLAVRRWSPRTLVIVAIVLYGAFPSVQLLHFAVAAAVDGRSPTPAAIAERRTAEEQRFADIVRRKHSPDYREVIRAQVDDVRQSYARPEFLLSLYVPLLLIGMAALRLRLFSDPKKHRGIVIAAMVAGALAWAAAEWVLPSITANSALDTDSLGSLFIASEANAGFGILDPGWLALTYIGAVLLILATARTTPRWLLPFSWAGRAALSNYFIHILVLDLLFTSYGLALAPPRAALPMLALVLFACDAIASRWWLSRYRYGPLEWLWRSVTYWSWQSQSRPADPGYSTVRQR